MQYRYEKKPNKTAFVAFKFIKITFYLIIFFVILYFIQRNFFRISLLTFFLAFFVIEGLIYLILNIKYKKERYIFLENKIIKKSGSIFSDSETELVIRNITNVVMKLPFIENKLFLTGYINIQSAGSGKAEIRLSSVDKPREMFSYIEKMMKHNGFKLTMSRLVQQEKPSSLGVFFEVFKKFFISVIVVFYIAADIAENFLELVFGNLSLAFIIIGIVLVPLLIKIIFNFLDLKKRIYMVFTDTIKFSEGFLSKNYSFIPIENLADSTVTQTLVDKIFGLYDVKISCQGSGNEILFKNMVNGPKLEQNIDSLISKSKSLVGTEKTRHSKKEHKISQTVSKPGAIRPDTTTTAQFKMDAKKTLAPPILIFVLFLMLSPLVVIFPAAIGGIFPVIIVLIVVSVRSIIELTCTLYFVKPNSIEKKFDFLTSKHKEFTNEKITAIIFRENFIDFFFKTCTIIFWSIGSEEDIKFANIKKTPRLYQDILAKKGIRQQEKIFSSDSHFKVLEMLKANLPLTLISILIITGSIFALAFNLFFVLIPLALICVYLVAVIYRTVYYKRSKLRFHKDYVYFQKGIFFKEFYYVLYDDIKDITTLKYPFSEFGRITFNVAGEHIVQRDKHKSVVSNNFTIRYIHGIDTKDELIDIIFYQRPAAQQILQMEKNVKSYSPKPIHTSKPDLANTLIPAIIISIIFFPLVIILPFIIIFVVWSVKVRSYSIQPYRAIAKSGIFYKKQTSIIFSKIDHINFHQGMLNKLFRNGSITVNTTGSSRPELKINNIPDFKEFYEILKKYY